MECCGGLVVLLSPPIVFPEGLEVPATAGICLAAGWEFHLIASFVGEPWVPLEGDLCCGLMQSRAPAIWRGGLCVPTCWEVHMAGPPSSGGENDRWCLMVGYSPQPLPLLPCTSEGDVGTELIPSTANESDGTLIPSGSNRDGEILRINEEVGLPLVCQTDLRLTGECGAKRGLRIQSGVFCVTMCCGHIGIWMGSWLGPLAR